MMLSMAVQLILGLVYFGSYAAFNAFNGSGVIFLTLSYVMPVATSFFRGRKAIYAGSFNLGILGSFCNVVSIGQSSKSPRLYAPFSNGLEFSLVLVGDSIIFDALSATRHIG